MSARPRMELDPWIVAAFVAVVGLFGLGFMGARLAPHEPIFFVVEHGSDLRPYEPGVVFPLGSDVLGRDMISLVLAGAGATLTIVLAGGAARVAAGILLAAVGGLWRPLRLLTESAAELVSAIPATLVALVLVKILVKADTTFLVFVGALLLIGWAGPYRIVRAEIDRLAHAPFIEGARSLGISGWRLFWRHQLPHLVPILAVNLAQQVVASLVLVAELGVLGTFVGTTRLINIEESLSRVIVGPPSVTQIADPPEWGGLLAGARTIEILWTTRWLIFVPGMAFAATAIAVGLVGFALARRYERRDIVDDLRGAGALVLAVVLAAVAVGGALIPERYAEARTWAADARGAVQAAPTDLAGAFGAAGLAPLGSSFAIDRQMTSLLQTAGASVRVGGVTLSERWPRDTTRAVYGDEVRSFVNADTGGGIVDAPLVFVGRGIAPLNPNAPVFRPRFGLQSPDLQSLLSHYADDYAGIDVRGKVVVLVRFLGFVHDTFDANGRIKGRRTVAGYTPYESIADAIERGAAAIVFVDADLPSYVDTYQGGASPTAGPPSPYARAEKLDPATAMGGVPVVVIGGKAAERLLMPLGISVGSLFGADDFGKLDGVASLSRDLGITARVAVPLEKTETHSSSVVGEVQGAPNDQGRVIVWTTLPEGGGSSSSIDALASLARTLAPRRVPFIFVAFDPSGDAGANRKLVLEALGTRRVGLVLVLLDLRGEALQFATPNGDLIPAFDLYAERAGARHVLTRSTSGLTAIGDALPIPLLRTVLIRGGGEDGDLRGDAGALIGYVAGRYALGAEELRR